MYDVTVIGPAVIDVLAAPFDPEGFAAGSRDMEKIRMSFGGDALNESVVLTRLGKKVQLISRIGADEAGRRILDYLRENGIGRDRVAVQEGLDTAVNIALIGPDGSRRFLMDPHSSLRRLGPADVLPLPADMAPIVCFASLFISPLFTAEALKDFFMQVKESGGTLVADMTRPKNGETIEDLRELLPLIDVFVPNDEEIASLTGVRDPEANVRLLLEAGVGAAIVKTGAEGCLVGTRMDPPIGAGPAPGSGGAFRAGGCRKEEAGTALEGTRGRPAGAGTASAPIDGGVRIRRIPAVPGVRCVDTTGAGDTFAAGLIAGLASGWEIGACARLGCAAASCSIGEVGATDGVRSLAQVLERLERIPPGAPLDL